MKTINKTLLPALSIALLAGVSTTPVYATSTIFESRDVLTSAQALGRFDWLKKCYQGLLLEVSDQMFDPTAPLSDEQKLENLKNVLLYTNGNLRPDAKYLTFGDENNDNPKNWFAGKSLTDSCVQIPSDYGVSAVMVTQSTPQHCAAKARVKDWEFIKAVSFSDMTNNSEAAFYSNFVGHAAKVYKNNSYVLSVTPGFTTPESFPEYWHVYFDWNRDGDFADAGETYYVGESETTLTKNITIPATATTGVTKMRISMDYLGGSTNACAEIDSGEIEDYLIYIK